MQEESLQHQLPKDCYYPGQPEDEKTLRVVYKHIFSIAPFLTAVVLLSAAAIVGVYYMGLYAEQVNTVVPLAYINLAGFILVGMLVFLFAATLWIWRRNKIVITDEHIVDVDQLGLFNRKVSTLRLGEIQDVTAKVNGPIQTMFQYGTVMIQTAGTRENFVMDYIYEPYELEHYILEVRKKFHNQVGSNALND